MSAVLEPPAEATPPRPWPVVLLTLLGAWLAALPFAALVGVLAWQLLMAGPGIYVIGALILGGALALLRARRLPLFVEQLAVPVLVVGLVCLAFGLYRDTSRPLGSTVLLLLALGCAAAVRTPWLRTALGAAAALFCALALLPYEPYSIEPPRYALLRWLSLYGGVAGWLLLAWEQRRASREPQPPAYGPALGEVLNGWALMTLLVLVWASGTTFLLSAVLGSMGQDLGLSVGATGRVVWLTGAGSVLVAALGMAWAAWQWPGLRRWPMLGVAALVLALCAVLPTLGGVVGIAAVLCGERRWRMAAAAAVAAVWVIGGFYYQLTWPLVLKAAWLAGGGAALGGLAWALGGVAVPQGLGRMRRGTLTASSLGLLGTALLTLALANGLIWQKERLIADGQSVYIPLLPQDPRSLMEGDYMALNFAVPEALREGLMNSTDTARPRAVAQLDATTHVAQMLRWAEADQILAAGQILLELSFQHGRWTVVTDAFFFKEGQAERFAAARFGEFRVLPDGRALLVGVADEKLQAIKP